jgi:hypothetical protein
MFLFSGIRGPFSAIFCLILILSGPDGYAQQLPDLDDFLEWTSLVPSKFETSVLRKDFFSKSVERSGDTVFRHYELPKIPATKRRDADTSLRRLIRVELKDKNKLIYTTTSVEEYRTLLEEFKEKKFICPENDADQKRTIFQLRDMLVETGMDSSESAALYSLTFFRKSFPAPVDVNYADDLFVFSSHEYLTHYFGEQNVRKDMYFISGNDMVNCSILFANSARQVVFLWHDQANRRGIRGILLGGQQNVAGATQLSNYVGQNNWVMKSGLFAGMTLYQLRVKNEADIVFHGGNSPDAGTVVADNKGKFNFNKEQVELGCINCSDEAFARAKLIQGDDALEEGRILFILSIAVQPSHLETSDW